MPSSANVSRGNGPLSGSSPSDIEGAEKQSPVNPRSFDVVSIETCGNKNDNPCKGVRLFLYNVMGQEDMYRREDGERVQRGGMARVVLTTTEESNVDIEYKRNPSKEDAPDFNKRLYKVSEEEKHHEFFFPVDPDALYAFRVNAQAPDCPNVDEWSSIYYFKTGDTIQVEFINFRSEVQTDRKAIGVNRSIVTSPQDAGFAGIPDRFVHDQVASSVQNAVTLAAPTKHTTTASAFSTSYSIAQN